MIENLKLIEEKRKKENYYASDFGKPDLDLYFSLTEEPVSNQRAWYETLRMAAGKGVEEQMLKILKDNGIVDPEYDQKTHGRVVLQLDGPRVHGYIDAMTRDGSPIEIKTINNKNSFDILRYRQNNPRENYVGQLAIYMEFTQADTGGLFVASIDGLNTFWFECKRIGKQQYQCGNTVVDVGKEFKRWERLWNEHIVPRKLPDIWQYRYKYDIHTIDWRQQSKSAIAKARKGTAVLGDYQVQWSPWKDKIVELQGTRLGYSNEELAVILEKTAGYTKWTK